MPSETRTGFYVRLPTTMLRKLRITAAKTGRSMQELVEGAIFVAQRERRRAATRWFGKRVTPRARRSPQRAAAERP